MILAAALVWAAGAACAAPTLPATVLSLGSGRPVTARVTYDLSRAAEGGYILVLPAFADSDASAARLCEALILGSGDLLGRGAVFARSHRIPAVAPVSARWEGDALQAEAPELGRPQRDGGLTIELAERSARVTLKEGDVATLDPSRGTVALSGVEDAAGDLAVAEALRAYDGLRSGQALLQWWQAHQAEEPRAGISLVAQLAQRLSDGGASAEDFKLVSRAVGEALPRSQRSALAQAERRAGEAAAAATAAALRDELASVREAATAQAVDRILERAQPSWQGLQALSSALGRPAPPAEAALWRQLREVAARRRGELSAQGQEGGLSAAAAVAGASVPAHAVLSSDVYRRFLAENGLEPRLAEVSRDASLGLRRKSARLRALILGGRLASQALSAVPRGEVFAVSGAYDEFPQVPRSELLGKVQQAWAAGFDPGPLGARLRAAQGGELPELEAEVSLTVSLPAEVSGRVLSRDPATGRRKLLIVSAAKAGSEEAGEEYLLDRRTGRDVRPAAAAEPLLSAAELAALARAARALDDHEGRGVELEFSRSAGRLYLLGCRPIP